MLFRLEVFVTDKHLAKALTALDGIGYNLQVQPVKDAETHKGKVREAGGPTGVELLTKYLRGLGSSITSTQELAAYCERNGQTYVAAMYAIKILTTQGALVRQKRGRYTIHVSKLTGEANG